MMSGCSREKHEKIDLSSTHTTAAETMAPAPSENPESEPETTEGITIDAAVENAANANSGKGSVSGQGSAASANSISTSMASYTSGKVSIQYPAVKYPDDISTEAAVNELIKKNALSVLDAYEVDESKDTVEVTCRVMAADRSRITITYTGSMMADGAAHPLNLFYTNTVDMRTASSLDLPSLVDPNTLAAYVLSDACVYPDASEDTKAALAQLNASESRDQAYYANLFKNADFPYEGSFPECFSYEYEGDIYFSIPVIHALGDYVIAVYTPENK
ncbi:MAG: hypothetical protein Q4C73_11255 [Eubacteriales bacterium]|nr:hypothetical protein [Eubacteriales bacterium]